MWFRGTKNGVSVWFILWGMSDLGYNAELYKTAYGVRQFLTNPVYRNLPVVRVGRAVLSESGLEEKEHWTKEEFLES